jgi:rhodanese-related sulfurtransferase
MKQATRRRPKDRLSIKKRQSGWIAVAAVAVLAIVAVVIWRQAGGSVARGLPAEISVAEAVAKRDEGAFILDVRQPEEWEEYHIPGSTLIPLEQLDERLAEVPGDREVVVVCRSGNRSQTGRDILLEAGFEQVTSMAGGVGEWRTAGYPTESGS